jgi:hypothetical protein
MMFIPTVYALHHLHYDVYKMSKLDPIFESDDKLVWIKYPKSARQMAGLPPLAKGKKTEEPYPVIPVELRIAFGMAVQYIMRLNDGCPIIELKSPKQPIPHEQRPIILFMRGKEVDGTKRVAQPEEPADKYGEFGMEESEDDGGNDLDVKPLEKNYDDVESVDEGD